MSGELARASREIRSAKLAVRRASRAIAQLHDANGRELGSYPLDPGEPLNDNEILHFLHLAVAHNTEGALITVTQPNRAQTEEQPDGKDI